MTGREATDCCGFFTVTPGRAPPGQPRLRVRFPTVPHPDRYRLRAMPPQSPTPLRLTGVRLVREGRTILAPLTWQVGEGERWIVLGANGSGKTTLIQIAGLYLHPSSGTVEVLGETLGRCDVRTVRQRIGFASAALAEQLRPQLSALDAVMTARYAALEPWWHRYTDDDRAAALKALARMGVEGYADRTDRHALVGRAPAGPAGPRPAHRARSPAARRAHRPT